MDELSSDELLRILALNEVVNHIKSVIDPSDMPTLPFKSMANLSYCLHSNSYHHFPGSYSLPFIRELIVWHQKQADYDRSSKMIEQIKGAIDQIDEDELMASRIRLEAERQKEPPHEIKQIGNWNLN